MTSSAQTYELYPCGGLESILGGVTLEEALARGRALVLDEIAKNGSKNVLELAEWHQENGVILVGTVASAQLVTYKDGANRDWKFEVRPKQPVKVKEGLALLNIRGH